MTIDQEYGMRLLRGKACSKSNGHFSDRSRHFTPCRVAYYSVHGSGSDSGLMVPELSRVWDLRAQSTVTYRTP